MTRDLQMPCRLVLSIAALATALVVGCGADPSQEPKHALPTDQTAIRNMDHGPIRTIDHRVPHISTAYANAGEHVELFVRERVGPDLRLDGEGDDDGQGSDDRAHEKARLPVVLMIAGATLPAVPVYDVPFENPGPPFEKYSWMAYLAEAGFDVFAMELTGYGLSPRPKMDDPCNTDLKNPAQQALLKKPCTHPELSPTFWPKKMAIQSDWDEIDRVVDYVHDLRGVDAVSLVGWSRAGPRIGGYAVQHPEKVEKLVLYSPAAYDRTGPTDGPRDPVTKALMPEPGVLMQLSTVKNFFDNWDRQLKVSGAESICGDQLPPGIRDVLKSGLLESDPVGSSLGKQPLWRAPVQNTLWGWNAETARNIRAPTLIIRGENDDQAPFDPQRELFEDLGADQDSQVDQDGETDQDAEANQKKLRKVFVRVACAGHQLLLERQHTRLLQASGEWLSHGSYAGHHRGSFFVDTQGQVTPAPLEDRNRSLARPTENVDQD